MEVFIQGFWNHIWCEQRSSLFAAYISRNLKIVKLRTCLHMYSDFTRYEAMLFASDRFLEINYQWQVHSVGVFHNEISAMMIITFLFIILILQTLWSLVSKGLGTICREKWHYWLISPSLCYTFWGTAVILRGFLAWYNLEKCRTIDRLREGNI